MKLLIVVEMLLSQVKERLNNKVKKEKERLNSKVKKNQEKKGLFVPFIVIRLSL